MMTYATFLEETYRALRATIPAVPLGTAFEAWLLSVGEVLLSLEPGLQYEWVEQYAALVMITYGNLVPSLAKMCIYSGMLAAAECRARELDCRERELMRRVEDLRRRVAATEGNG